MFQETKNLSSPHNGIIYTNDMRDDDSPAHPLFAVGDTVYIRENDCFIEGTIIEALNYHRSEVQWAYAIHTKAGRMSGYKQTRFGNIWLIHDRSEFDTTLDYLATI